MIKHIVMFSLKPEAEGKTAAEHAVAIKQMLEALVGKIPQIVHLEVTTEIFAADPKCDVALYSEFKTKEDLKIYADHPLHQECVAYIGKVRESRYVLDYVI